MISIKSLLENKTLYDIGKNDLLDTRLSSNEISQIIHLRNVSLNIENPTDELLIFMRACSTEKYPIKLMHCVKVLLLKHDSDKTSAFMSLIKFIKSNYETIYYDKYTSIDATYIKELLLWSVWLKKEVEFVLDIVYSFLFKYKNWYDLTLTVNNLLKLSSNENTQRFKELYYESIDLHRKNNEYALLEKMLNESLPLKNSDFVDIEYLRRAYANTLERFGDLISRDLSKSNFYQDASEQYSILGDNDDLIRVLSKLNYSNKVIQENMQAIKFEISSETHSEIKKHNDLLELYFQLSSVEDQVNNIGRFIMIKDEDGKNYSLYSPYLIREKIVREKRNKTLVDFVKVQTLRNNKMINERIGQSDERLLSMRIFIDINSVYVTGRVAQYNVSFLREIRKIANGNNWIKDETRSYYYFIEKYFSKDTVIEFCHFGVILVEKIVRDLYENINGSSIISKKNAKRLQISLNLQDLLKDQSLIERLSYELIDYLRYVLIDEEGMNLRNELLHGLYNIEEIYYSHSLVLIHIIIVLIQVRMDLKVGEVEMIQY